MAAAKRPRVPPSGPFTPQIFGNQGYFSMAGVTQTIPASGTFVRITGPYVLDADSVNVDVPTPGVTRYTGRNGRLRVSLRASVAVTKVGGIVTAAIQFNVGGISLPNSTMPVQVVAGVPLVVVTFHTIVIERLTEMFVEIENVTNADDLIIQGIQFGVVGGNES